MDVHFTGLAKYSIVWNKCRPYVYYFFSKPYIRNRGPMFIKFYNFFLGQWIFSSFKSILFDNFSMPYIYSRPYVYYFVKFSKPYMYSLPNFGNKIPNLNAVLYFIADPVTCVHCAVLGCWCGLRQCALSAASWFTLVANTEV